MCLIILFRWIINALILMLIPLFVPGFEIESFFSAMVVAVILALVNSVIRPVIMILTLPINVLTLGLFTIIVNGFMFYLVSVIVKGFTVTSFWSAVLAALIYSLISMLISYFSHDSSEIKVKRIR